MNTTKNFIATVAVSTVVAIGPSNHALAANGDCVSRAIYDYCTAAMGGVLLASAFAGKTKAEAAGKMLKSWERISKPLASKPPLSKELKKKVTDKALNDLLNDTSATINGCLFQNVEAFQQVTIKSTEFCESE